MGGTNSTASVPMQGTFALSESGIEPYIILVYYLLAIAMHAIFTRFLYKYYKTPLADLRVLIPASFVVELFFTLSFLYVDLYDFTFILTLGIHSVFEILIAFNILFPKEKILILSKHVCTVFTFSIILAYATQPPLSLLVVGLAFILPADIFTFLASVTVLSRTSDSEVQKPFFLWLFHLVLAMTIFACFMFEVPTAYLWVANAAYWVLFAYLFLPIAKYSDEELTAKGVLPASSDDKALASLESEIPQFHHSRLQDVKTAFFVATAIYSIYLIAVLAAFLATKSFDQIYLNAANYYIGGKVFAFNSL